MIRYFSFGRESSEMEPFTWGTTSPSWL